MSDSSPYNNFVVQINVLNSLEVLEENARKKWPVKWGFYLDFPKMILEKAAERGVSEERYKQLMNTKKIKCASYQETLSAFVETVDYIPKTSSGFVGWRCDAKYTLEKFGPLYISPKHTLPYQPPYNCIILG